MSAFQPFIIMLCVLASAVCTWLLFRGWRRTGTSLLFWSALCFVGLTANNLLVFFDLIVFPVEVDLRPFRLAASLGAIAVLLWGLVWEAD